MKLLSILCLQMTTLLLTGGVIFAAEPEAADLTFGAVADIQYADKASKVSRYYRKSLERARDFVAAMNQAKPVFVITLGDHTDGQMKSEHRKADVVAVSEVLKNLTSPLKIVLGNHDAAANGRDLLKAAFGINEFHYTFTVPGHAGWRFIVLDGNDGKGTYVMSDAQIEWFRSELSKAKAAKERVICFCHQPLLNEASPRKHTLKNPQAVLKVMDEAGDGLVQAWICGHDHTGGYAFRKGVHHLTMPGMVETDDSTSYAIISLKADRMVVEGTGRAPCCELKYGQAPVIAPVMNDINKKPAVKEESVPLPKAA